MLEHAGRNSRGAESPPLCGLAGPLRLRSASLPEGRTRDQRRAGFVHPAPTERGEFPRCTAPSSLSGFRGFTGPLMSCEFQVRPRQHHHGHLNNKTKSFPHFSFPFEGENVWNTGPIKTFPVSDVSITDLAPKVKCFGLQKCTLYGGLPINQQGRYVKHRKISTAVLLLILLVI